MGVKNEVGVCAASAVKSPPNALAADKKRSLFPLFEEKNMGKNPSHKTPLQYTLKTTVPTSTRLEEEGIVKS